MGVKTWDNSKGIKSVYDLKQKKNLGGKKKKINHSISRKSVIIITFIHKNTHKKVYQLG